MANARKLPAGSWQGSYRDAAGKRHTRTWPTKTAAMTWANDGEASVRSGAHRNPRAGRITLGTWHARWLAARVVQDATHRRDRTYAKDVLARWSAMPLDAITRMEVQGWVADLTAAGRGPHAVAEAVQQLTSVLEAAVLDDLIPSNPARRVRLPTPPRQPDRILTEAEEPLLLAAMPTAQDRRMVEVLLDTGLRYGELAGLHAHRVNLLRRELHVVETLTQLGKVKAMPKSAASNRTIPLPPRAVLALAAQLEGRDRDGLVFRTMRGSRPMMQPNWRVRAWYPAIEAAGLDAPPPTPHDLRHTALTRLIAEGTDIKTVQAIAGHESLTTTLRYLHAQSDAHDKVRVALDRIAERRR